jgi:DeoR/GlpR family transcriptional regulator of sugar metabolism
VTPKSDTSPPAHAALPAGRAARLRPLRQDRRTRILEALADNGTVQVAAIAAELDVSEMTVRRDLIDLEKSGKLVRVHGGAVAGRAETAKKFDRYEPVFDARIQRERRAKERIAAAAIRLAADYRTVALDVGTTTFLMAALLNENSDTKIFTNSVRIAAELGDGPLEVYLSGGRMRKDEMSLCGATAIANLQSLWFDIAFLGISGLTVSGVYDYSLEDTEVKRVYIRRSGITVALCDASKFERMSLVQVAPLSDFDILITDARPPDDIAAALSDAGVQLVIAEAEADESRPANSSSDKPQ